METLRKLTHDLLDLRYKVRTDDNVVTERQVQQWIRQQRAIWVSNELNKNRFESAYWQETGKLGLIEHPDYGSDFKTAANIPPLIQVNHRPALIEVNKGTPFGEKFPWLLLQDGRWMGNRRFDAKTIYSFYTNNGQILLRRPVDDSDLKFDALTDVNVVGIYEDPMDLKVFDKTDGSPQYHEDMPYPIHLKLYTYMREHITKVNFPVEAQSTQDVINDSQAQD